MGENQSGIFFGLLAGAFWGFSFLIPKLMPGISPSQIALGRFEWFGIFSVFTLIFQGGFRKKAPFFQYWKKAILLSLSGYSVYFFLLVIAIHQIGIPLSSLIVGLVPVTVALLSRDPVRNPRLFYFGLGLILFGMGILNRAVFSSEYAFWQSSSGSGMVVAFACLSLWTYFALMNGRFLKQNAQVKPEEWSSILGVYTAIASLVIDFCVRILNLESNATSRISYLNLKFLLGTGFLGFFSTYFATRLWNRASLALPTGLVAQLIVSETLFALIYHFCQEGLFPQASEWLGMGAVILGVLLAIRAYQIFDSEKAKNSPSPL